jgi:tetratricopeptide (TPR) repeat protein
LLAEDSKEEAREVASNATLHSTGLIPALELYARLSDELGYTDDAINAYKRLLALEKTLGETRRWAETQLADLLLRLHRYEEAEAYVESAIEMPHATRSMFLKAAVVLGACTKLERALGLLDRLLIQDPHDGAVLEKKLLVLWLMHRYEDAAEVAREALTIMPDNELCLCRMVEYETLIGNQSRANHFRKRLERLQCAQD